MTSGMASRLRAEGAAATKFYPRGLGPAGGINPASGFRLSEAGTERNSHRPESTIGLAARGRGPKRHPPRDAAAAANPGSNPSLSGGAGSAHWIVIDAVSEIVLIPFGVPVRPVAKAK